MKSDNAGGACPAREEQRKALYLRQKHTLDLFLERGAISRAQYDKSLGDLTSKMGMEGAAGAGPDNETPFRAERPLQEGAGTRS